MKKLANMSKKELIAKLKEVSSRVTDKNLKDMVAYTLKKIEESTRNVTKDDLVTLLSDLLTNEPLPIENNAKKEEPKKAKIKAKKEAKKAEKEEPKKDTKKAEKDAKKDVKKSKKEVKKEVKKIFPEELGIKDTNFKLDLDIESIKQLKKLVEEDNKEIIFAFYWTKRHLKQYYNSYDIRGITAKEKVKEFPNDLDLCMPLYISEDNKVIYVISIYTEVIYQIIPEELKVFKDETESLRFCNSIEYNLYIAE
ncbi:MAG: hypothetical protein H0Z24_05700 [Thermosipho sp. (in: Bacteria)]|nr:hypothetical protein [Thermosipho sp. (in: thermotogales)]